MHLAQFLEGLLDPLVEVLQDDEQDDLAMLDATWIYQSDECHLTFQVNIGLHGSLY